MQKLTSLMELILWDTILSFGRGNPKNKTMITDKGWEISNVSY